jgi:hypothetical protein
MNSPVSAPILLYPGQAARPLIRLQRVHSKFDERFLQELLASNPELLPAASIRHDVGKLLCIGREVGVPSGSIDNLYLSTAGYPVLVETKLWRNPQARREVLSQTLDYIKDLVLLDFEWFEAQWKIHMAGTPHQDVSLLERLSKLAEEEIDEREFIDRVNHALARGDILAMIVGDGIQSRLQELVSHLCKDLPHLRYALALCELPFFQLGDSDSDGMIVVPRIVSNVEPVQRAYVRVDIADNLAGKVVVTPVLVEPKLENRTVRVNLDEDALLRSVEASVGSDIRKQFEAAYNELIDSFGLEPDFRSAALMLKIPDPEGEKNGASVIAFEKHGRVYNTEFLPGRLRKWGSIAPEICQKIAKDYWATLHKIDSRFPLNGISHMSPKRFIPFGDLLDKWPSIKNAIGEVAARVRTAAGASKHSA